MKKSNIPCGHFSCYHAVPNNTAFQDMMIKSSYKKSHNIPTPAASLSKEEFNIPLDKLYFRNSFSRQPTALLLSPNINNQEKYLNMK